MTFARDQIHLELVRWFRKQRRVLPWREEPSPYRVWISEIMLQQTQVVTVVPYFDRFVTLFPTVQALAQAPEESVMLAWAGLGYYSRARNLHRGARQIVERLSRGEGFPRDREEWIEIPGVGPYTAGAICSIALNQPEALVDGNVERVLSRLFCVRRGKSETVYREKLWELARASVEAARNSKLSYSELNQGWMELGALICTPKSPKCDLCPLRSACGAFQSKKVEKFPEKKAPKQWVMVAEKRVAVFDRTGGRVALRQAAAGEWRAGLWDFPERLPPALSAETLGELESKHVVTRHKILRTTKAMRLRREPRESPGIRWVSVDAPEVALGSAPKKVIQLLRERYFSGN